MAFTLFTKLPANMAGGETAGETKAIDWLSCTPKVMLLTSSYTPDQDADELYSDISADEVGSGNGYTTAGNACANPSMTVTGASNKVTFDADDPATWTASGAGFSFRYIVVYDSTSGILIGYDDYGSTVNADGTNGDTFTYTFDAAGIFTTTVP
jgi:hypothetical protein